MKNYKLVTESDLTNIRSELSNIRQGVVEETLNAVQQKVDSGGRNTASRLGAFSLKLGRFQQQPAEVCRHRKDGKENMCETRIEDDNVITPSEVYQTNDSHLHGLYEHGKSQCHHSILNELALPQFSCSTKQNIVQFLNDLEQYFCPKEIRDSIKLLIAPKTVTDIYK